MGIDLSASATWHPDTMLPISLTLWAQGEGEELARFAQRYGMDPVDALWSGRPLAVRELRVDEASKPVEQALSLLGLFEQSGHSIRWLQDLAPDLHSRFTAPNVYLSRADFIEALQQVGQLQQTGGLVHA